MAPRRLGRGDDDCRDDREAEQRANGERVGGKDAHAARSLRCDIKNLRAIVNRALAEGDGMARIQSILKNWNIEAGSRVNATAVMNAT